jgi:hypothetical protein
VEHHRNQLFIPLMDQVDPDRLRWEVHPIMAISDKEMVVLRRQQQGVYEEDWEVIPWIFLNIDRMTVVDARRILDHTPELDDIEAMRELSQPHMIDRMTVIGARRKLYHTLAKTLTTDRAYRVLHAVSPKKRQIEKWILRQYTK